MSTEELNAEDDDKILKPFWEETVEDAENLLMNYEK